MGARTFRTLLAVAGLFDGWKRKQPAGAASKSATVKLEMPASTAPAAPETPIEPSMHPLRRDLRFKGLHSDVDPTPNVKGAEMACPNCERSIRYIVNSNGTPTTVRCPGCARQYRV